MTAPTAWRCCASGRRSGHRRSTPTSRSSTSRPPRRGEGLGEKLLEAALDASREAGAKFIHLGTSTDDKAARGLYEKLGFTDREGDPDGPLMIFYEREL